MNRRKAASIYKAANLSQPCFPPNTLYARGTPRPKGLWRPRAGAAGPHLALPGSLRAIAVGGAKAFASNGHLPSRLSLAGYTCRMGPHAEIPKCHLAPGHRGSRVGHRGPELRLVRCWVVSLCQAAPMQVLCQCCCGEETSEVGSVLLKNWFPRL